MRSWGTLWVLCGVFLVFQGAIVAPGVMRLWDLMTPEADLHQIRPFSRELCDPDYQACDLILSVEAYNEAVISPPDNPLTLMGPICRLSTTGSYCYNLGGWSRPYQYGPTAEFTAPIDYETWMDCPGTPDSGYIDGAEAIQIAMEFPALLLDTPMIGKA